MYRFWRVCCLCLLGILLLNVSGAKAAVTSSLVLTDQKSMFSATPVVEYFEDPSLQLNLNQVTSSAYSANFQINKKNNLNFGHSRSAWWVRFQVQNQSDLTWYLLLDSSLGADLDLYIFPQDASTQQQGSLTSHYAKPIPNYMRHAWSLNLPKDQLFQVYMRVTNGDAVLALPIKLVSADDFVEYSVQNYRLISFIYAGMIVIGLYQLFMSFALKDVSYLLLAIYVWTLTVAMHRTNPIFPDLSFLSDTNYYFYSAPFLIALAAHLEFARRSLDLKIYAPKLNKVYIGVSCLVFGLVFVVGTIPARAIILPLLALGLLIILLFVSYYIASKGSRLAFYFALIYWLPICIQLSSLTVLLFKENEWNAFIEPLASIGTLFFILLLSVLQAERVRLLREQMKQVEVTSAAKEAFLAVMSHELRTPMNSIMGLTTLLKLSPLNQKQKSYVDKLDLASEYIMQLINNVLEYAKLTSYTFQPKPEACKLSLALDSILPLIQQQADLKGLDFSFESQGNLNSYLLLDRISLTQVLLNLLNNAVKYTEKGSVKLSVQVQTVKNKQRLVVFRVTDTGVGIPAQQLESLFEPFTQLQPQTSRQGIGLGLAISKRLVAAMGSDLTVKSKLGSGSEFSFELSLPLAPYEETGLHKENTTLAQGLRLLVADNSEFNQPETSTMLRELGADVQVVSNQQQAILCLQEQDVDMMLVDISSPDLDGLELSRWVRSSGRNPKLPIVAMTSDLPATNFEPVYEEIGITAYLRKPLDYQSLSTALNRALAA